MNFWIGYSIILGLSLLYGFNTGNYIFAWITGLLGGGILGFGMLLGTVVLVLGFLAAKEKQKMDARNKCR